MADVFISHARANRDQAATLAAALESGGRTAWLADAGGTDRARAVERELEAAGTVLVAWSGAARESLWVRAQANAALDAGKLVQLRLDETVPPSPFAMMPAADLALWSGARGQAPWPEVEARIASAETAAGESGRAPFIPPAERALQGFGQVAALGWTALGATLLLAIFIIAAARGNIGGGTLGIVALVVLVLALGLLAVAGYLLIRTMQASR